MSISSAKNYKLKKREAKPQVHLKKHEEAVVGSFSVEIAVSQEIIEACLEKEIITLKNWINVNHGIIGHIKAGIQSEGPFMMYSITDEALNKKEKRSNKKILEVAAIVYFIEQSALKEAMEKVLNSINSLK